ncbi:MAG: hypothetical protein LBI04_02590 [Treponema sp.]|jgi:hypothetical protein|nr:hypothetical protein [Treponema sp.]
MKITKRGWFFHLLGLLALVMVFGVILAGCDVSTITIGGGLVIGGIIGKALGHVFIGIVIGGIIGLIGFIKLSKIIDSDSSSSSSSSSKPSNTAVMAAWAESREKDPHTCGNCTRYSSVKGECRDNGNTKSAEDSCSNWQ